MILEAAKSNLALFVQHYHRNNMNLKKHSVSLSAAAVALILLWRLCKHRDNKKTIDSSLLPPLVKGGIPLIGNMLDLQKDPYRFLEDTKRNYGPCFRLQIPSQGKLVVVTGPLIGEVMKSKHFSFPLGIESLVPASKVVKISYEHKFVSETISKRAKHPVIYPLKHNFKESQIDVFSERIQSSLKSALDNELGLAPDEERSVNVWETLTMLISASSCPCFAGSRVGSNKELVAGMALFTQKIIKAGVFITLLPGWLGNFVVRRFFSVEHEMDLIMNLLVPELKKIKEDKEAGKDDHEVTFASMVLDLPKEDGSLRSIQDAAYYFNSIALASIHTTSHFASFAIHEVACRPSLAQDLRDEIATLGNDITPETVGKLPLMDSFFREVLRCDTDYLGMHHLAIEDTTLSSGHFIPKGSLVVGAVIQAHCDTSELSYIDESAAASGKHLEEFDAYRFVDKKVKSTSIGLEHLTFGFGAHACPGRYFAANEIKYIMAEILMRYNIRTQSGHRAQDKVLLGMTKFPPREPLLFSRR